MPNGIRRDTRNARQGHQPKRGWIYITINTTEIQVVLQEGPRAVFIGAAGVSENESSSHAADSAAGKADGRDTPKVCVSHPCPFKLGLVLLNRVWECHF